MFIGLTGSISSGKEVVADYLIPKGFVYLSLSNELREIAQKKKINLTRENLQDLGNEMRKKEGLTFLAKRITEKINSQQYKQVVIDGIRNPAEVIFFKQNLKNFFLVSVDAPPKIRFERLLKRDRESDPKTFKDFLKVDARDKGKGEPIEGQQVGKCMKLAKFILINEGTYEEALEKVEKLYGDLDRSLERPSWDEYFMEIAEVVSRRATCNRGRNGCIIVKDKQILATGYVGSPMGLEHCDEVGHLMKTVTDEEGNSSKHCLRTAHCELNAISQAAKYGISINGSTMYLKMAPCPTCAKTMINSGIKRVVCKKKYHHVGEESIIMFKKAGIKIEFLTEEIMEYSSQ
ncbi:AAA family ATPase [Candidatus Pacearchaeota archaeon]|nr:AAA family ATPase [Candidatus Pacearchaeota archaeon]